MSRTKSQVIFPDTGAFDARNECLWFDKQLRMFVRIRFQILDFIRVWGVWNNISDGRYRKKNSKTISFPFCTRLFKHAFRFPTVKATVHKRKRKEKKWNSEIDGNKKKSESKRNPRTHTPLHNKLERSSEKFYNVCET